MQPVILDKDGITIEIEVAEEVLLKDFNVGSDSSLIKSKVEKELESLIGMKASNRRLYTKEIKYSSLMPAGNYQVHITAFFENREGMESSSSQNIKLVIPEGLSPLSSITADMIHLFKNRERTEIPRLPTELTKAEIKRANLSGIGLTPQDIENDNYEIHEIKSDNVTITVTPEDARRMLLEQDNPLVIEALKSIINMEAVTLKKSFKVFEVLNVETNAKTFQTKVMISFSDSIGIIDLEFVEFIPKDMTMNADQLTFSEYPIILEYDPIVKWDFNNIPKGQTKDYSYVVNKEIDRLDSQTLAGVTRPGKLARFINFILRGGWIIILLVLGVLIGLGIYMIRNRKKK